MSTPAQGAVCPDRNSPTNHHALKRYTPALTLHMICPYMSSIAFFTHTPPSLLLPSPPPFSFFPVLTRKDVEGTGGQGNAEGLTCRAELMRDLKCRRRMTEMICLRSAATTSCPLHRYGLASCTYPRDAGRALGGSGSGQSEHLGSLTREHSPQPASLICCFFFLCSLCFALSLSATFLDTPPPRSYA